MSTPMPAAWYPDPSAPGQLRWWDGTQWTENVSSGPSGQSPQPGQQASFGQQTQFGQQAPFGQPSFGQPSKLGPGGREYAEFWQRAVALIVDSIILIIPTIVIFAILGASGGGLGYGLGGSFGATYLLAALVSIAIHAAYFIYLIGTQGQTIGMRAMSIRVVDAQGGIPGLETSGRRWLIPGGLEALGVLPVLGAIAGLAGLVNYLSMLWDDQNQCWHDKFANTWVVKGN